MFLFSSFSPSSLPSSASTMLKWSAGHHIVPHSIKQQSSKLSWWQFLWASQKSSLSPSLYALTEYGSRMNHPCKYVTRQRAIQCFSRIFDINQRYRRNEINYVFILMLPYMVFHFAISFLNFTSTAIVPFFYDWNDDLVDLRTVMSLTNVSLLNLESYSKVTVSSILLSFVTNPLGLYYQSSEDSSYNGD